jgi:hypothetical protein
MSTKRVNTNTWTTPPSAEELAILQHPRVLALQPALKNFPPSKCVLKPDEPFAGPSRFLELGYQYNSRASAWVEWISPAGTGWVGLDRGLGFGTLSERPRIDQNLPRPAKLPHIWFTLGVMVVSPQVRDVFCRRDAASVEFCEIDWEYSDGSRLEGYGFLDVTRLVRAYDFARSTVEVSLQDDGTRTIFVPGRNLSFRDDIPQDIHFFREERWRRLYVSREFANELAPFAANDVVFEDPNDPLNPVRFPRRKPKAAAQPAPPPAIVHSLPPAAVPTSASLSRKIAREILPRLEAAEFAHAEQLLVKWIRELPESSLHVALAPATVITTPPAEVADFIDSFRRNWTLPGTPKVIYAEMNAFTVNTDEWFFDLFGFARAGSREDYDWLGDFDTFTERRQVITGMEALQTAYEQGGINADKCPPRGTHPMRESDERRGISPGLLQGQKLKRTPTL